MYLEDIKGYVNNFLYYYYCSKEEKQKLDLEEIIAYLSSVEEVIDDIEEYLDNLDI